MRTRVIAQLLSTQPTSLTQDIQEAVARPAPTHPYVSHAMLRTASRLQGYRQSKGLSCVCVDACQLSPTHPINLLPSAVHGATSSPLVKEPTPPLPARVLAPLTRLQSRKGRHHALTLATTTSAA